ncbi:MAG: hypothetical protein NC820_05865 [Candidatus Omnitrophica bacterium]|nr:hypothetical protein [Candidatus Omnitrophota bacterium]
MEIIIFIVWLFIIILNILTYIKNKTEGEKIFKTTNSPSVKQKLYKHEYKEPKQKTIAKEKYSSSQDKIIEHKINLDIPQPVEKNIIDLSYKELERGIIFTVILGEPKAYDFLKTYYPYRKDKF